MKEETWISWLEMSSSSVKSKSRYGLDLGPNSLELSLIWPGMGI